VKEQVLITIYLSEEIVTILSKQFYNGTFQITI